MTGPTPGQLQAADLIAVTELNGKPVRTWDPVHKNFPPTTVYATPAVTEYTVTFANTQGETYPPLTLATGATFTLPSAPTSAPAGYVFSDWGDGSHTYAPGSTYTMPAANVTMTAIFSPVPLPPPPGTGPSGRAVPPVASGFTRAGFDDFTSTTLSSLWSGAYNGQSNAAQPGIFLGTHLVLQGDSLLRLEAYSDPNWANSWEATQAIASAVNNVCGAGVQTGTRWPVGTTFTWTCKWDTCPGLTPIVLTMGNTWPPEQDLIEADVSTAGAAQTGYTSSYLYAPGPTQEQVPVKLPTGITDFSQWHLWQLKWTSAGSLLTCDGNVVVNIPFTSAMVSGVNGLQNVQFLALQHQTGDPSNPSAPITTPVTMYFDWVAIDVPA